MENKEVESTNSQNEKVGQEQIHDLLFSEKLSWQAIIYDLINTEQLDPWDIDLRVLADKYLVKLRELDEANFFISSKVLLAASLLLRLKSEIILYMDLPGFDEILFGEKKKEKKYEQERLELGEEVPLLIPRTPLPRSRKVSLEELMSALGEAIATETRRIEKVVVDKQRFMEADIAIPKRKINVHDEMKKVYDKLKEIFKQREDKISFSELAGKKSGEKISVFVPLLHLDNQHKICLEQDGHLEEIWVWMKDLYDRKHAELLAQLSREVEEAMQEESGEKIKEGVGKNDD